MKYCGFCKQTVPPDHNTLTCWYRRHQATVTALIQQRDIDRLESWYQLPSRKEEPVLVELKGTILSCGRDHTAILADDPHECPKCHRMTFFFENRNGETRCTACPTTYHLDSK